MINDEKKRIVMGLGSTGQSFIRYFDRLGLNFSVVDSRESPPNVKEINRAYPSMNLYLGKTHSNLLGSADEIYLTPGVSLDDPFLSEAKNNSVKMINDIDLFVSLANAPIILITGSNGKSTVTELVGLMARENNINVQVGGNIGRPALDTISENCELYILELSSFQLEMCSNLSSSIACILNITEDHLDRHGSIENYKKIKQKIYKNCKVCIFNREDISTYPVGNKIKSLISFGLDEAVGQDYGLVVKNNETFVSKGKQIITNIKTFSPKGDYNLLNALSAITIAEAAGMNHESIISALQKFKGLPHRCEEVVKTSNVTFYNDSKATNTGATIAAIERLTKNFPGKLIILIGGKSNQDDFSKLFSLLEKINHQLILFGESVEKIVSYSKNPENYIYVESMQSAVEISYSISNSGDIVLLSPACSSLDMFLNFEERGDSFKKIVLELSNKIKSEVIH